jgi:phage tail-like protein
VNTVANFSGNPVAGDALEDPISVHHFGLEVAGIQAGIFSKCSSIVSETKFVEHNQVGPLGTIFRQMVPGHYNWTNTVKLSRGITSNTALWDWRKLVLEGMYEMARKTVTITGFSQDNKPVIQFTLLRAWPTKYTLPEWDASAHNKVAEESVDLTFEALVMVKS